ncbi:MAG: transglycosylase SLT domain-containing protein [Gemmatimonadota bacterium]|nr:transglycosylase SLT domain-containing protein [Gemmatimonadota bacterium]
MTWRAPEASVRGGVNVREGEGACMLREGRRAMYEHHRTLRRSARRVAAISMLAAFAAAPAPLIGQTDTSSARPPASADGAPGGPATSAAVSRVRALLDADMPVTASATLSRELSLGVIDGFDAVILAARAHAEQRSWGAVRRLLVGRDWTDPGLESEALLLLGAAYRGLDSASRAVDTYRTWLEGAPAPVPAVVRVDYARALLEADDPAGAAVQLGAAARDHPDIARWARLSRLNSLVRARDTTAFALADSLAVTPLVPADSAWRAAAELAFRLEQPDRAVAYARRASDGVWRELAEDHVIPYLAAKGDSRGLLEAYRLVIARGRTRASTGEALLALDDSWETRVDVARSDLRSGRSSRAIGHLRAALADAPEDERAPIAHVLADAYASAGDHERVLETIDPYVSDPRVTSDRRASLWLLAARTHAALGNEPRSAAAFDSAAAGTGNDAAFAAYLIADSRHDAEQLDAARAAYEHAATDFPGSSFGSRSLERLALLHYREGRYDEARARLAEYRRRYPDGEWVQGAIYWHAKTLEAEGDSAGARAGYLETLAYNPLDYYALLAADRVSRDPWETVRVRDDAPAPALAPVYAETVERMNHLRELGWTWRARWEYQDVRERGPTDPAQVLAFAHALNEGGWTQEGVQQGWRAKARRSGWTRSQLRAIYPLPYPEALAHAARDRGLEPHFVAGLARRESLFDPEIRSVANAIGLMQVLPETARDVARRAGLPEYQRSQLTVPQVNLLLGTRYLADVLGRFGGDPIAGMISYNAGPHRFVRWRDFPEFADSETLVERIPFRETREYVRAVTELREIYRFLYPELGSTVP